MAQAFVSTSIVFLCFIGYLQPFHSAPWPSAINDGVFLILGFICIGTAIAKPGPSKLSFSRAEILVLGLLVVHLSASSLVFDNRSVAPYGLVLFVALFCYKSSIGNLTNKKLLLTGIWLSAAVTAVIGIGQWLGAWDQWVSRFLWMLDINAGARLAGNLGQPNVTGTLLIWGVVSAAILASQLEDGFLGMTRERVGQGVLSASVLLITIASALTQSRTTTLAFIAIAVIAWVHRTLYGKRALRLILAACALHIMLVAALPVISHLLFESELTTAFGGKGIVDHSRLDTYAIFLRAIFEKPFFGYGMGGTVAAFINGIDARPGIGQYFAHAHNLVLELLVWFGIPLGLFLVFGIGRFIFRAYVRIKTRSDVAVFSILAAVFIHSMLELPLHYAYFLIPVAIFAANFSQPEPNQTFVLPKLVAATALFICGFVFVLIANDYFRMEQEIRQARLELAITGRAHPPSDSPPILLKELYGANVMLRTEVSSNMNQSELKLFEETTAQFPMRPLIEKNIKALTLNGQVVKADYWKDKYCAIYGQKACQSLTPDSVR